MEVPPGRLEVSTQGGKAALISLLSEIEKRRLNGLLALTRVRGDSPSHGVLVFNGGNGSLASHTGRETFDGPRAVSAILRDALSPEASLELRSYDHRGSTIRIDQLENAHPEARINGIPDITSVLADIEAEQRTERSRIADQAAIPDLAEVHGDLRTIKNGSRS